MTGIRWAQWLAQSILTVLCIASVQAQTSSLNKGLLSSSRNQQAQLVLTAVPLGLVGVENVVTVRWSPAVTGELRYSLVPGGSIPGNYPATLASSDLETNTGGELTFLGNKLDAGVYYCIIVSGSDNSTEFIVVREADVSPRMITPRSARGETGINTNSPTFTWESVNGVPFYHVLLSDQPFEVIKEDDGSTNTEGANIIWQAITSETSIPYGTPDPSGYFNTTSPPPLVNGVRYNWIVLNNFGNNPALTSSVASGPTGFDVAVPPPFAAPQAISPGYNEVLTSEFITFEWSEIEGASLYHLYVSRFEDIRGSQALLPIWDGVTSNRLYDLAAAVLQQEGTYYWKVLAQDESGNGAMGDTTAFFYSARSAHINFWTVDLEEQPVPRSTLELTSLSLGTSPQILPANRTGFLERDLPLGSYEVTASKEGFEDTTVVFHLEVEGETRNMNIAMRQSPASVYGSTKNASQNALGFVDVAAVSQNTGETKRTTSDINGNYALSLAGGNWTFSASKGGYSTTAERSVFVSAGANVNLDDHGGAFTLTKNTYTLNGFILTPSGESIWGASFKAILGGTEEATVSDAQGQYSVTLGTGSWTIEVAKEGYVSPLPQQVEIIDHSLNLNLTLTPKANIVSGRVTTEGVALGDVQVVAVPNSGQTITVLTNAYGQYTFSLGRGTYQIAPQKSGYVSPNARDFTLDVGQTLSAVDFNMQPQTSFVTGQVTSGGASLQGVTVSNGSESTTTGSNGRYSLGVLHGTYTISASRSGYLSGREQSVTLTPGQTLSGINFSLTPNASVITGTIKNASLPVSGASVVATNASSGALTSTKTDANGNFSFSVTAASYTLEASKTGFMSDPDELSVTVNPGQTLPNQDFSFVENVSYVSGLIKTASGPLRNASVLVKATGSTGNAFSTITSVDGSFSVSVLPGYSYSVTASHNGYFEKTASTGLLTAGQTGNVTLTLTPHQSRISGRISAQGGGALAEATIEASSGATAFSTQSDGTGSYSLGVDAGDYEVTVRRSGYVSQQRDVTVGLGDTLSGSNYVLVSNFASLDGVITNAATNELIANCLVVATETSSESGGSAYSGSQGHYLIQNLQLGVYNITISHPAFETKVLTNRVFSGGSSNRINVALTPQNGGISGTVMNGGSAIAGVTVAASSSKSNESTVTGANGSYSLSNLAPGNYTVQVSLTGYSSSDPQNVEVEGNATSSADFTVTANESKIEGRLTENGSGVSNAQILAVGNAGNSGFTNSTADGSYQIPNLAPDDYKVYVKLDRYVSSPDTLEIALGPGVTESANFAMTRSEITISGVVGDQANSPLAAIVVVGESAKGTGETTTDENGRFDLTGLPANAEYTIRTNIFKVGYANDARTVTARNSNLSGIALEVTIRTGKIRGNVGLVGATVSAAHQSRELVFSTTSQPDGSFLLENLYDGAYTVTVGKVGYAVTPAQRAVNNLGIGEERTGVNFTLAEIRIAVSGKVRDQNNAALANVPVLAQSAEISGRDTTDANGNFTIENLAPNLTYSLQTKLAAMDYTNGRASATVAESNVSGQNLTVKVHNAGISGTVSKSSGEVIADALVSIVELDSATYTDDEGAYQFNHLYAGTYTVTVSKQGLATVAPASVSLGQGQQMNRDFSNLTPLSSAISGVVTTDTRRLRNAVVTITDQTTGTTAGWDTTDAGGIYTFQNLDGDRLFTVKVTKTGFAKQTSSDLSPSDGELSLDFDLSPVPNSFYGRVMHAETGAIEPNALVTVNGISGGTWTDSTDAFGQFSVTGLAQGAYSVVAESNDLISPSQTVNLNSGSSDEMTLELEQTGSIAGSVTYLGNGRAGANITATNTLAGVIVSTTSEQDGSFAIRGLLNGNYVVTCAVTGFSVAPSQNQVSIADGGTETVDFVLTAETNGIIGTVSDTRENLVRGVKILVTNGSLRDSTSSDLNGQFQITGLLDGSYTVSASLSGYTSPAPQGFTLVGGQPEIVDIILTQIINSISGFVQDGLSGQGVSEATVTAVRDTSTFTATTDIDGSYLFEVDAGAYEISAQKDGYEEGNPVEVVLQSGGSVVQNLVLTPIFTTGTIAGAVFRKGAPVLDARVICTSLSDVSLRDTVFTDDSGNYAFAELPAPAEYLLEVNKQGLVTLASPVLSLTEAGIAYNFAFPSGQIKWMVTRNGVQPLSGVTVKLTGESQDLTLLTNNEGVGQTSDNLTLGDYSVTLEADRNTLLPSQYAIALVSDSVAVLEEIQLPLVHSATDSVPAEDSMAVRFFALTEIDSTVWLFYKSVDAVAFERIPMTAAATSNGDTIVYTATIPAQGRAGEVPYFVEFEHQARSYSNANNPFIGVVTNEGIFTRLDLSPARKNVQPGVPVLLQTRAYDGVNKVLIPDSVSWKIAAGEGELNNYSEDSTSVWFVSQKDTLSVIQVRMYYRGVAINANATIESKYRILASLEIKGGKLESENTEPVLFSYSAADTGGVVMSVLPIWSFEPSGSGRLNVSSDRESSIFQPDPSFIGQVQIFLRDSISGVKVQFNAEDGVNEGDTGLKIFQVITADENEVEVSDGQGFSLVVPPGAAAPGSQLRVKLRKPQVPDVKRFTGKYTVSGNIYDINVSGSISSGARFAMELPVVAQEGREKLVVGHWDLDELSWSLVESDNQTSSITAYTTHFSEFAVLLPSDPLGVRSLRLLPNPFSPNDPYGLQIAFNLTSDDIRKPWVTVKIYNMRGELVRTLLDKFPMSPLNYEPGGSETLMWDGLADDGKMARNGRYIVRIVATDGSGSKEEVKTVVLIK